MARSIRQSSGASASLGHGTRAANVGVRRFDGGGRSRRATVRRGGGLAGGTHHAFRETGAGFCVFNDIAVAIAASGKRDESGAPPFLTSMSIRATGLPRSSRPTKRS